MAKLSELLNMVLQLDASDRAQAMLDLQTQQARQGAMAEFVNTLGRVQNPQQLGQLKQLYAGAGIPVGTLDEVARQYTPTMAQIQEQTAQAGLMQMPQDQLQFMQRASATRATTGLTAGGLAADQAAAEDYANPEFNNPVARKASHFGRIGYNPGAFAMSEATANLAPGELKQMARIAGGTGIGASDMAHLMMNRDQFQVQAGMALKQFNRGVFEGDRNYAMQLSQLGAENTYKEAQAAALRAKAAAGDPEALKELRSLLEDVDKAKSPLVKSVFSQMIENQLAPHVGATPKPLQSPATSERPNYAPNWWERHF